MAIARHQSAKAVWRSLPAVYRYRQCDRFIAEGAFLLKIMISTLIYWERTRQGDRTNNDCQIKYQGVGWVITKCNPTHTKRKQWGRMLGFGASTKPTGDAIALPGDLWERHRFKNTAIEYLGYKLSQF